jgi:peptidoglycan lytic transglycosylase
VRTSIRAALAAACAIALAGCAVTRPPAAPAPLPRGLYPPAPNVLATPNAAPRYEPRSKLGNPPFYDVDGHRYYVLPSAQGYVARGVASWYGPKFFGLRTSDGERYDMFAMTAAHKTLPLPCYVRVTNLQNGRSVVVRVNDRGPFVANRLIDLSYAAAAKLGMLLHGTAFVEVRAITPESPSGSELTRASQAPPPQLYVQVGAFADQANAWRLYDKLRRADFRKAFVLSLPEKHRLFRVRVGPLTGVSEYDEIVARLAKIGITGAVLEIE